MDILYLLEVFSKAQVIHVVETSQHWRHHSFSYALSRCIWRQRSTARRSLRDPLVFRVLDLIQLSLDVGQCLEDVPPQFVLILQAGLSLGMMRPV
jgi:hypothetical protein